MLFYFLALFLAEGLFVFCIYLITSIKNINSKDILEKFFIKLKIANMVTVAEYCKLRGVTRQFVSEYIKKGKIQAVELVAAVQPVERLKHVVMALAEVLGKMVF